MSYPDGNPKTPYGVVKPSTFNIPAPALLAWGEVMKLGAEKYGRLNWRLHMVAASVYSDALMRHFLAWRDGEERDPESGQPHLAHVMACAAILIDAQALDQMIDDRHIGGEDINKRNPEIPL